jgi:hypothetical protein
MADFLVPFLTGGITQYLSDEDASDALKGNIIDNVSKKLYDEEIPQAEKEIKAIEKIKVGIRNNFGEGATKAFENMGFLDSGDERLALDSIRRYLDNLKDTTGTTEEAFKARVNKLYTDSQGVGTEATKAATEFKNSFGGASPLDLRIQQLEDRKTKVNNLFNDRANIRDLIVSPSAPKEGIRGMLFGDRVTPGDVPGAMARITEATKVDTPDIDTAGGGQSLFAAPGGEQGLRPFDIKETEDRQLKNEFISNFKSNVQDAILRDKKAFATVFPTFAEDYRNAVDIGGYKGTEQDYYSERYIKNQFALRGIDYTSAVDKVDAKTKKLLAEGEKRVEDSGIDFTVKPTVTEETKSGAFAFGESTAEIDYAMKVDEINISVSNAIAKVLRNTTLTEEERENEINRVKQAAQQKLKELGPPPKTTGAEAQGSLVP